MLCQTSIAAAEPAIVAAEPAIALHHGSLKVVDGDSIASAAAPMPGLIYLNRDGGSFEPGFDDSVEDISSIIGQSRWVSPSDIEDDAWAEVLNCVRLQFAAYNVEITDEDPIDAAHFEAVLAGYPTDIGMAGYVVGVSPFRPDCSPIENSIVFAFSAALRNDPQTLCEIATQEIGHSFGLDHSYVCGDVMSYLFSDPETEKLCGPKSFLDVEGPCGEFGPRSCSSSFYDCGRETQNSHQHLLDLLGERAHGSSGPEVEILSPQDGDLVDLGFVVDVVAEDDFGVSDMELRVDGRLVSTTSGRSFRIPGPQKLDVGEHLIEIVAYDLDGNAGRARVGVRAVRPWNQANIDSGATLAPLRDAEPAPEASAAGCSASGGRDASAALFALAALAAARRRKRQRP